MMECDVCGGTEPPRNPLWRDNITKMCDPCWNAIGAKAFAMREVLEAIRSSNTFRMLRHSLQDRIHGVLRR
jgi:hypothetical protein